MQRRHLLAAVFLCFAVSGFGAAAPCWGQDHGSKNPRSLTLAGGQTTLVLAEHLADALEAQGKIGPVEVRSTGVTDTQPWWQVTPPAAAVLQDEMGAETRRAFAAHWGHPPTHLIAGVNAVTVVVPAGGPLADRGLSLAELDALFSETRLRNHSEIRTWGEFGLHEAGGNRPIVLHGQDASGPHYALFRRTALQGGTFKDAVQRWPGPAAVVDAVSREPGAIGYAGLASLNPSVTAVPVAPETGSDPVSPTAETVLAGHYPLAAPLHLYVNRAATRTGDAAHTVWVRFLFSSEGRKLLRNAGFVPLSPEAAERQLQEAGLSRD